MLTRLLHDASSGNLTLLGDYLLAPTNGGVFQLNTSTGILPSFSSTILPMIDSVTNGNWSTVFGNNGVGAYDNWTLNGTVQMGEEKLVQSDTKYDHVFFIIRNARSVPDEQGRAVPGSPGSLMGHAANTYTYFGGGGHTPVRIMCHEFCHLLFGSNNFHCAGGGNSLSQPQYWISQVGGWSLMGAANSSLQTWSAWDRLHLGWKIAAQADSVIIPLHDASNTAIVNGDLDAQEPSDTGTYVLRDFVTSGDALRIKLPFTDSIAEYPEFLWVENHQGRNLNEHPFDRWHFEDAECVVDLEPGLYMYMQIDRDLRQDSSKSVLYGGYEDYLRPLIASGHFDIAYTGDTVPAACVGGMDEFVFLRQRPNPLTGMGDTHWNPVERNGDNALSRSGGDFRLQSTEFAEGANHSHLYNLGHARHGFQPEGADQNHKLGIGTNPSSATAMNIVGANGNVPFNSVKNLRRIYLNGVSVELMAQNPDGSIKVKVRFDDVDVKNDARWCADTIQLNPVATSTGYSLNVTAGNTVTLDRGTTATRRNNPETYGGQQVFTSPTLMRCPATTWLNLAPGGGFVVDNGSTLRLESGSRMDVGNGAVLRVKRGGKLELMGGSVLNVLPGGQVIIEEDWQPWNHGRLVYHPNARINLEASTSVLEFAGVLDIQADAIFTPARSGDPNTTYGLVKFTNTYPTSYNVSAGANSRFILRGTSPNSRILHVQQESLYGPPQLVEFSLLNAKATLAPYARIVPPVSNSTTVKFDNAVVTSSTGVRNSHRGVRLNGQALLTLSKSTFSKGTYGVYSYNTTLGYSPVPDKCSFIDCGTGMYNYDKGIKAIQSRFDQCNNGLVCVQMSQASYMGGCSARYNSDTGVRFQGSSTLHVEDPAFNFNSVGLEVSGATAVVACGSVSLNKRCGFLVRHGGTLRMDDNGGGHDPVTAVKNGFSIICQQANNIYLDLGLNSLKPMVPGTQNSLNGTFLCQPYPAQPARKNNWNGTVGTPLTNADYSITACGTPLQFVDPSSSTEAPCGQMPFAAPPAAEAPGGMPLPCLMGSCPSCSMVLDVDSVLLPFNQASMAAMELGYNDSLPDNELLALAAFHALLANPMTNPGDQEKLLLAYDHGLMLESFGDALGKGQLSTASDNVVLDLHLAMMTDVEDARIGAAATEGQDDFIFYTSMERAQITRAAGKYDDAIAQMQAIPQPADTGEQALLSTILCYTQTERSVLNGTYTWDDVEAAMLQCTGHGGPKMMMQPVAEGPDASPTAQPALQPNPATSEVLVQGFAGEDCTLRLLDITGRVVVQEVRFEGTTLLPLGSVRPGTYLCRISGTSGQTWTGRLVVGL